MLRIQEDLQVIGEVSDGLEAVQTAEELQPDLILLDISLPKLNGIEAARRMRECCPHSRILFVTGDSSRDIAEEALSAGGDGYIVKSDAATELLPAITALLHGMVYVSSRIAGQDGIRTTQLPNEDPGDGTAVAVLPQQNLNITHRHEVEFYFDDRKLLEDLTLFIGASLRAGSAAIVIATESHRDSLLERLRVYGVDVRAAIEEGRYITLDAAGTLSMFMANDKPDAARFLKAFDSVIRTTRRTVKGEYRRVAFFGECVDLLWSQGNAIAAIQMEKLGNELTNSYDVDILCGYSLAPARRKMDSQTLQRICAEHSAVHYR
jgi:CheY-like chemotaxis protein